MTLTELRARVRAVLRDDDAHFIADEDINAWLNEGQDDVAARTKYLQKTITQVDVQFTADSELALPADFLSVVLLELPGYGYREAKFLDQHEFSRWFNGVAYPPETYFSIRGDKLRLVPKAGVATEFILTYARKPVALAADGTECDLPTTLERRIVNFAISHGKLMSEELQSAQHYMDLYERGLPPPQDDADRKVQGPISMTYEPNHFDNVGVHRG
jgi:hypothetical protein